MGGAYLDSSAVVKLVRPEPETDALRRYLDPRRPLVISELAVTEVRRAARRIGVDPAETLASCEVVVLRSADLERAGELDPPVLRTLDAIQLAVGLALADDLDVFVAYDERLLAAAAANGFATASPS